jgi:coenzyme F420 biosynthesis associated uncharacterized protein
LIETQTGLSSVGRIIRRLGFGLLEDSDGLVDWRQAAGVAIDYTGEDWAGAFIEPAVTREFAGYVKRVAPAVADFTGLELSDPLGAPVVFNRSEWAAATAQDIKPLLEALMESVAGPDYARQAGPLARAAVAGQLGLVLGYLAKRVLGQYDSSLTVEEDRPGRLFFIYPNIVQTERRLGVDPQAFRLWLALHEVTHGFEFKANPWLKGYIQGLIQDHMAFAKAKLERVGTGGDDAEAEGFTGKLSLTKSFGELMRPEDSPTLAKIQAVMSVLEGYSEHVMAETADKVLPGTADIGSLLERARGNRSWPQSLIERLIGLDVKLEQYRLGRLFVKQAADAGGMELANEIWRPGNLPTLTELQQPELWVARMRKYG